MIHEHLIHHVDEAAAKLQMPANAFINALIESCFREMQAQKASVPSIIQLYRRATRKDLSGADKLVMIWLEKHFPGWKQKTEEYRRLTVRIASEVDNLDAKEIEAAADQAYKTGQ